MKFKKILVTLLSLILVTGLMPMPAFAAGTAITPVEINIATAMAGGDGYTYESKIMGGKNIGVVTIKDNGYYTISGSTTNKCIAVGSALTDVNVTLNSVNIDVNDTTDGCAFDIGEGAKVNLTLDGTNSLKSGYNRAGLQVAYQNPWETINTVAIDGTGSLTALGGGGDDWGTGGAGIGGYEVLTFCGNIIINSGTITATGGNGSAGIGAGAASNLGGDITINGGTVIAHGSINSSTNAKGAGIGSYYDNTKTISINGGNITAHSEGRAMGPTVNVNNGYYTYWTNTSNVDNSGTTGTSVPGGAVFANNDSYKFVKITDNRASVNNIGGSASLTYSGSVINLASVTGLFTVDSNGGTRTYSLEPGSTGAGSISGSSLTVTKAGTFNIGLITAGTTTHKSGVKVTGVLTVNKAAGGAVGSLTAENVTHNSITVNAVSLLSNPDSQTVEYAINDENVTPATWQEARTFGPLVANTNYHIFARSKANDLYEAGVPVRTMMATSPIPVLHIPTKDQFICSLAAKAYNGKAQGVSVTPKSGVGNVIAIYYNDSKTEPQNIGSYKVTIDAAEGAKYEEINGLSLGTFKIVPSATSISKITAGKKKMTVKWKKVSAAQKITKYEVRYRIKGGSKWTTKSFSASVSSATFKNLKKGKRYEVQVRSYKTINKVKHTSAWSKTVTGAKIK